VQTELSPTESAAPLRGRSADRDGDQGERAGGRASGVRMRGLTKRFPGGVVALDDVSLEIQPGEFFTLLGPSGCGKTTMLRILAGLETPDRGTVHIGDHEVTSVPPHRRSVNTVFQSYALFTHNNVRDNIGFGLRMRGVPRAERYRRVESVAGFIRITELLDRYVDQLSGGQQQRIALARALINEPDLLLLDEPLSALDAGLRSQLQVELLRIQKSLGMTFIFVTHDQQEAMVMSDRIAVLHGGTIQQMGPVREVYEHPGNRFVAGFMGHANIFEVSVHGNDRIDTPFGQWRRPPGFGGDVSGGSGHALVRPETVRFGDGTRSSDHCERVRAVVRERLYRGGITEYRLVSNDTPLTVTVSNSGIEQEEYAENAEVDLMIDPRHLVFLE